MIHLWNALLLIASLSILVPMVVWSAECIAALLPLPERDRWDGTHRPSVAVLVPAHNEASGIGKTLQSLAPQLQQGDRVIVIADNCTDDTAGVARKYGVVVVERHDLEHVGKSYALDYGARSLGVDLPEVFAVIDADCTVYPGAIDQIARMACATGSAVQANYLIEPPPDQSPQHEIAALALLIKNFVRPTGLDRMGLPCFLNGSGMAFPASRIQGTVLANGRIAEDRWLTADLALAGCTPRFCREAKVTSRFPTQKHAEASQRTRWLHGHLECMLMCSPRLFLAAIWRGRFDLLVLALDLLVPPLSLLVVLWLAVLAGALAAGLRAGWWVPAILVATGAMLMTLSFLGVMLKFGRRLVPVLLAGPSYVLSKLPVYAGFFVRREKKWVPTERDPLPPPK